MTENDFKSIDEKIEDVSVEKLDKLQQSVSELSSRLDLKSSLLKFGG